MPTSSQFPIGSKVQQTGKFQDDKVYEVAAIYEDRVTLTAVNEAAKQWLHYLRCFSGLDVKANELKQATNFQTELMNCPLPRLANVCGSL